jgi:hypothetical protein
MPTQDREQLLQLLEDLSADQVRQVLEFTRSLLPHGGPERPVDESDRWSEEDLQDVTLAAWREAEDAVPYHETGDQLAL